jgi:RNA polymerase sigma factor FliA
MTPAERDRLVTDTLPLARSLAGRHDGGWAACDADDLAQAGAIGLLEAAGRYDPAGGAKFTTFAWPYVTGRITDELRARLRHGRGEGRWQQPLSLDMPVDCGGTSDRHVTLGDTIEDGGAARALERAEARATLAPALAKLAPRDRRLLALRYGAGWTWERIGRALGVSHERARQRHAAALRRLRALLEPPPRRALPGRGTPDQRANGWAR